MEKLDRLSQIFHKQRSLMEKYEEIEEENGLLQTSDIPVNLDDKFGQARLKDFAWRFTEELGEAIESFVLDKEEEAEVEIVDALHFLTEFTILSGLNPKDLVKPTPGTEDFDLLSILYVRATDYVPPILDGANVEDLVYMVGLVISDMALTTHKLKNKPWKRKYVETDQNAFYDSLRKTWIRFIALCILADIDSQRLFELYFNKAEINKTRQESGY